MTRSFINFSLTTILCIFFLDNVSALCGREGFRITGSADVKPMAIAWARAYGAQCGWQVLVDPPNGGLLSTQTNIIITEERGDISSDMLCRNSWNSTNSRLSNVDIVMSNRPIFNRPPSPSGSYNCTGTTSNTSRGFIQVEVVADSVPVIVNRTGIANDCITILGGGLTQDQLRWIFSRNTTTQLQAMGWSDTSLSRGTGPLNERRWSRLHMRCSRSLITVAIPSLNTNYYNFFQSAVMRNVSQGIPSSSISILPVNNNFKNDEEIANFVRNNGAAIGYIGYPSFVTKQSILRAVAIQNSGGNFVIPNELSILSNSYNPLSRRLYMNVRRDTLSISRYFLEFAYSNYGDQITRGNGYTQVPTRDQLIMFAELGSIDPACLGNETGCLILPAPINTNCISLASIECCSGNNNLKVFITDNAEKHFNIWKIYFEAACANTQITLIKNIQSSSSFFRTCKLSPDSDFLDITAVGSKINEINNPNLYPASDPKFIYKCTKNQASFQAYSPPRSLLEFTMAPNPGRFLYTNRATSARSRTRCFLKFALCVLGTQVLQCNGLSFNDFAVTTGQMCKRNNDY